MRLSWGVMSCQTIILILGGLSIGMEVISFMNDLYWNSMLDNEKYRFPFTEFVKCENYMENGTLLTFNLQDYKNLFNPVHRRDLPFEQIFLELMCVSFVMYMIAMNVYIGWKNVMANIYIAIVSNLIGMLIHMGSFGLILTSTLMYTDSRRNLQGSTACYNFHCVSSSCADKDYRERTLERHDDTRDCMEKLHICQSDGFKNRTVFLVLGCIVASAVALFSSCRRLIRHRNRFGIHRIIPNTNTPKIQMEKKIIAQPSLENEIKCENGEAL